MILSAANLYIVSAIKSHLELFSLLLYNCFIMDRIENLKNEAVKLLENKKGSHDWEHTERVYNMCLHIAAVENANVLIVKAASLLHDIGRHEQDRQKGKVSHADIGVQMALPILETHGFDADEIRQILHCIKTHSYRKGPSPLTLEAKILFDADKLDAIGAIGIGRAFVFAGEVGAAVHIRNLDIPNTRSYSRQDTAYREFKVKLEKITDCIYTGEGKRIAVQRHNYMVEFFMRLNSEACGEI